MEKHKSFHSHLHDKNGILLKKHIGKFERKNVYHQTGHGCIIKQDMLVTEKSDGLDFFYKYSHTTIIFLLYLLFLEKFITQYYHNL